MNKLPIRIGISMIAALLLCGLTAAHAQTVRAAVTIRGEIAPGVYGRIDIGSVPQPVMLYEQPIIIKQSRRHRHSQPIYLHVPPGHAKNWGKYCYRYNACDQRVYFVRSREYEPHYQPEHQRRDHDKHYDKHQDRRDKHHDR
jgi:hypothetical protein